MPRFRQTCGVWFVILIAAATGWATEKGPMRPLVRDINVGYLMNYTFRAIRPYIWKQQPLLTGWETDSSGGTWESQPAGFLPDSFGFNVDQFRLCDVSAEHAVTIRHQIVRQTAGRITWAFRFQLPEGMEGANWQLRDLEQPAVSITTHNGTLCYETSTRTIPLAELKSDHEYGVQVVADLDARRADIYVDGELKAARAPFARPVESIDCVLIKTGDAAIGNMVLPLVSVHKGFRVCEPFSACGRGQVPADWEVQGQPGSASVESLACAAKPDVFSLQLANQSEVGKRFEACSTKTVWEFKFLLPKRSAGLTARLLHGDVAVGQFAAADGSLGYVTPGGQSVPITPDCRTNLWYHLKVVADPQTGRADISVNGKQVVQDTRFCTPGQSIDAIRFNTSSDATVWLDDIRVYPWQDYPQDYVPEPVRVTRKGNHLVGVQSCSLWKEGNAYAGWEYVVPFAERRKPYLGWYDEGNPEVADWEIKWQVEHGIDFELYCWYRPNDAVNHPIKEGVLEHGIREGLFNARYSHLKKFAIMYTNQGAGITNNEDWREHIVPYWIEYFFKDPRYLKIDGKPVLSIYDPASFLRDFEGVDGGKKATDLLREACAAAGFPGVIILMELRTAQGDIMSQMKAMGIDYCYAYTWGTGDVSRQRQNNLAQREAADDTGFRMLPSISMGWQTAPWDGGKDPGNAWAKAADYQNLAQWARDEFMPTFPEDSLGRKLLLLANWNEFGEGHFLMPSNLNGFGYLDALRDVFTVGGAHHDATPNDVQKQRFNTLFPRE